MNPSPYRMLITLVFTTLASGQVLASAPIDDFRINDIEQNLRDLQTTVRDQARLISELQQQLNGNRKPSTPTNSSNSNIVASSGDQRWLSLANWQKLKLGMSELQVIEVLGAPTQVRGSDDQRSRSLLYAMEIGRSGFLTGKITVVSGQTTAIEIPTLK